MSSEFQIFEGKSRDIMREIIEQADLIVEGGSGTNMWPLTGFRRLGYKGPYVRMDLMYPETSLEQPDSYTTERGRKIKDFWSYGGNCFRTEHVIPVLEKFSPNNPVFVSNSTLANALFDPKDLTHFNKKSSEDRIPVPQAVEFLNGLYRVQLHISPAGFAVIASPEYERRHPNKVKGIPKVNSYDGLVVLDVRGSLYSFDRFKTFIEESAKAGWQFCLPTEDYDVLYMKRA